METGGVIEAEAGITDSSETTRRYPLRHLRIRRPCPRVTRYALMQDGIAGAHLGRAADIDVIKIILLRT